MQLLGKQYKKGKPMTQTPKKEKLNKIEAKANKHPLLLKQELEHFASIGWRRWTSLNVTRAWVVGFFHRTVTPGLFMMRMRIPNGILTSGRCGTGGNRAALWKRCRISRPGQC